MANRIQRILFSISVVSPTLIIASVVSIVLNGKSPWAISILIIGAMLSIYDFLLVALCKKHFERIRIAFDSVSPNDSWCIAYVITYIIPCLSFVLEPLNPIVTGIIAVIIGLVISAANVIPPNPILRLCGYHFYKASSIDGANDYNLISKRSGIHNKRTVNKVICAFDYILIEEKNDDV